MEKHVTLSQLETAIKRVKAVVVALIDKATESFNQALSKKVDDAPADGKPYVRQDNAWKEVESSSVEFATDEEVNTMLDNIFGDEGANEE